MPNNNRSWIRRILPTAHQLALDEVVLPRLKQLRGKVLVLGAGLEPYRQMLEKSESVLVTDASNELPGVDVVVDAHELPFAAAEFDSVVAVEVFEHLKNPRLAAKEVHRVLRDSGCALISTPFLFRMHGDPHDYQRFTAQGLKELFSEFCQVTITPFGGRRHVFSDLITTATRLLIPMRVANHILASGVFGHRASPDCPSGYVAQAVK